MCPCIDGIGSILNYLPGLALIFLACMVVFPGIGNLGFTLLVLLTWAEEPLCPAYQEFMLDPILFSSKK
jgi:hypothetical protein